MGCAHPTGRGATRLHRRCFRPSSPRLQPNLLRLLRPDHASSSRSPFAQSFIASQRCSEPLCELFRRCSTCDVASPPLHLLSLRLFRARTLGVSTDDGTADACDMSASRRQKACPCPSPLRQHFDAAQRKQLGQAQLAQLALHALEAARQASELIKHVLRASHGLRTAYRAPALIHHLLIASPDRLAPQPSHRRTLASTSTAPARAGKEDKDAQSLENRRTFAAVEGKDGCGGFLMGLGGKEGRSGLNVWSFTRETTQHRLIPPVRLSTIALSRDGVYMAGGTPDGRILLWEVSSGTLLVTVDAHYRSISALAFSDDGAALVSGSEDAGVSVWSVGRLLNASPMDPPTPYATLSDHTLPVTDVCVGLGSFPRCRVMSASLDSTVKIWDISTSPASLLSTFSFPHSITHIAFDALERYFFAAGPASPSTSSAATPSTAEAPAASSRVVRVNLYRKRKDEFGIEVAEPVGGGGRGEVERVGEGAGKEGEVYEVADTITSLHLSPHSPSLFVGLASSAIHVLSLPSLLPSRILAPPPSSTSPGAITFLQTLLRPPELGASSSSSGTGIGGEVPLRRVMPQGMGRTVVVPEERERGGPKGRVVEMRIGAAGSGLRLDELICPARGLTPLSLATAGTGSSVVAGGAAGALEKERNRANDLEREVEVLKRELGRAVSVNEGMWKKVVEGALDRR
ncbi:Pre-rRNA-processing protein IPI3 [Rhodotorula toruloides]|nr:Pre-rRNA-processing protein IPI3 [Rhodotorula toruloides]